MGRRSPSIADAFAQVECVACFKAVMDSQVGLDYIIEDTEFTRKLANALDTDNAPVKKQVFELLSALCMYSSEGHARAIDALEHYKESKQQRYRFGLILDELSRAETTSYKTTLVAFINCILIATDSVEDRIRIRNEFVGLKLLDLLTNLRKTESEDLDLVVQLDVFDDKKVADEEQFSGPRGVDLNNPVDVFHVLFKQVCDTPQSTPFLTILQHLLRIDPKDKIGDVIWEISEKLIHKAVLLEKKEYAEKLLKLGEREIARSVASLRGRTDSVTSSPRLENGKEVLTPRLENGTINPAAATSDGTVVRDPPQKMGVADASCVSESIQSHTTTDGISFSKTSSSLSPPTSLPISSPISPPLPPPMAGSPIPSLPAPAMGGMPPPPPPPPPGPGVPPPPPPGPGVPPPPPPGPGVPPPPPPAPGCPPPPPGMPGMPGVPSIPTMPSSSAIPNVKPKTRMRTLNWVKLPPRKIMNANNSIWSKVNQIENGINADWKIVEELFCQPNLMKQKRKEGKEKEIQKKRDSQEINILDSRRSLNVNIFLRQFRTTNDVIIGLIADGRSSEIGAEKLKSLLKILPENDEIEMLRSFDGDGAKLGQAEKFFIQLVEIPNYKVRVESMLLREEFTANMDYLMPSIESIIGASKELLKSSSLKNILHLVLTTGNFLNAGGYAGNAFGFKLSSLLKLVETRANKPRMNLLHYVAQLAEEKNAELMDFPEELTHLEEASRFAIDQLLADVKALQEKVEMVSKQVNEITDEYKQKIQNFLQGAKDDLDDIDSMLEDVEKLRVDLAEYFCEDPATFKLEECILTFKIFCEKFKKAIVENETRKVQEQRAIQRQKQREQQRTATLKRKDSAKRGPSRSVSAPSGEKSNSIVDKLLFNIRDGFTSRNQGIDTDGTTTDSDYGSRPTSPIPEGKVPIEETQPPLSRSSLGRRSFQKLNAISETSVQARDEVDVDTRGSTRSGPSEPQSDDALLNLLLKGNEEDPMGQMQSFKREGSVRRSGRKRRSAQYTITDSRERSESPSAVFSERENKELNRPQRTESENIDQSRSDDGVNLRSPQMRSFRTRPSPDSPENLLALNSISRREKPKDFINDDNNVTNPAEQTIHREAKSQIDMARPISCGSDDGSLCSEVTEALSERSETHSVCDDIHRDRIAMYANMKHSASNSSDLDRRLSCESEVSVSGNTPTFKPIQSLENSKDSELNSHVDSEGNGKQPKTNLKTTANNHEGMIHNLDNNQNQDKSQKIEESGASINVAEHSGDRLPDWQNQLKSMNIAAAVNTVESSLYNRNPDQNDDKKKKSVPPLERRESEYRARLRQWKSMRSESTNRDPTLSPDQLTERRRENDSYNDKPSEVFSDTPITPHFALEALQTESFEEQYREKINRERQVLESIMMGQAAADASEKEKPVAETEETTPPTRPLGLKALKLKRLSSADIGSDSDDDPWSGIDQRQIEIRRDISDIKMEQHRRSESLTEMTVISTSPEKELLPSTLPALEDNVVIEDLEPKQDINQNIKISSQLPESKTLSSDVQIDGDVIYQLSGTETCAQHLGESISNQTCSKTIDVITDTPTNEVPESKSAGEVTTKSPKEIRRVESETKDGEPSIVANNAHKSTEKLDSANTSHVENRSTKIIGGNSKTSGKRTVRSPNSLSKTSISNAGKTSPMSRSGSIRSPVSSRNSTPSPRSTLSTSRSSTPSSRSGTPGTSKRISTSNSPRVAQGVKANGVSKEQSRASSIDSLYSVGSAISERGRSDSPASITSSVSSVSLTRRVAGTVKTAASTPRTVSAKKTVLRPTPVSASGTKAIGSPRTLPGSAKHVAAMKTTNSSSPQSKKHFIRGAPERTTIASSALHSSTSSLSAKASTRSSLRGTSTTENLSVTSASKSPSPRNTARGPSSTNGTFNRTGSVRRPAVPIKNTGGSKAISLPSASSSTVKKTSNISSKANPAGISSGFLKKSDGTQSAGTNRNKPTCKDDEKGVAGLSDTKTMRKAQTVIEEAKEHTARSAVEALHERLSLKDSSDIHGSDELKDKPAVEKIDTTSSEGLNTPIKPLEHTRSTSDPDLLRKTESSSSVTMPNSKQNVTFKRQVPHRRSLPLNTKSVLLSDGKKTAKQGKLSRFMNRLTLSGPRKGDKLDSSIREDADEHLGTDEVVTAPSASMKVKKGNANSSKEKLSRHKSASFREKPSRKAMSPGRSTKDSDAKSPTKRRSWRSSSVKGKEKPSISTSTSSRR